MKMLLAPLVAVLSLTAAAALAAPSREAQLQDLEVLRTVYVEASPVLTPAARERARAMIEALKAKAGTLSDAQLTVGVMEVVALADNGHDEAGPRKGWQPQLRSPIRLVWLHDGMVITHASADQQDLLGARIVRLEGLTPEQLMARLRRYGGGTDAYRRWNLGFVLTQSDLLHAMGVAKDPDRLRIAAVTPRGRRIERTLVFRPIAEAPPGMTFHQLWSGEAAPGAAAKGWRGARDGKGQPFYLADLDQTFRIVDLPDWDAHYVQFRSNLDAERPISAFAAEIRERMAKRPRRNLIVDLRFNTGGNIDLTRALLRDMAKATPGEIYVLTGQLTFSAGIVSASALKHDAAGRVTILGEEVGDRLRFWSEAGRPCLPNSGVCFSVSRGYWDLVDGCADEPKCYGDRFDAASGSIRPDIEARTSVRDWLAGRDPVLDALGRRLKRPLAAPPAR